VVPGFRDWFIAVGDVRLLRDCAAPTPKVEQLINPSIVLVDVDEPSDDRQSPVFGAVAGNVSAYPDVAAPPCSVVVLELLRLLNTIDPVVELDLPIVNEIAAGIETPTVVLPRVIELALAAPIVMGCELVVSRLKLLPDAAWSVPYILISCLAVETVL
jgi:hypothetical protein